MKPMIESIKTLLSSKRAMVATVTILLDAAVLLGLNVDPSVAEALAMLITALGGTLIVGISASDHGAAMGQPAGVDHKGRAVIAPVVTSRLEQMVIPANPPYTFGGDLDSGEYSEPAEPGPATPEEPGNSEEPKGA